MEGPYGPHTLVHEGACAIKVSMKAQSVLPPAYIWCFIAHGPPTSHPILDCRLPLGACFFPLLHSQGERLAALASFRRTGLSRGNVEHPFKFKVLFCTLLDYLGLPLPSASSFKSRSFRRSRNLPFLKWISYGSPSSRYRSERRLPGEAEKRLGAFSRCRACSR